MLVVVEYLFAEFVDELIKDEVDLGFDLVVEKLLVKVVQRVVCTVTVEIEGVEDVPVGENGSQSTHNSSYYQVTHVHSMSNARQD